MTKLEAEAILDGSNFGRQTIQKRVRRSRTEASASQPQPSLDARRSSPSGVAGYSPSGTTTSTPTSPKRARTQSRPYPQLTPTSSRSQIPSGSIYVDSSVAGPSFFSSASSTTSSSLPPEPYTLSLNQCGTSGTTQFSSPPFEDPEWILTEASSAPHYEAAQSSSWPLEDVPSNELADEEWLSKYLVTYLEIPKMIGFTPAPAPIDLSSGISEEELVKRWDQSAPMWCNPLPSPPLNANRSDIRHTPRGISPLPSSIESLWKNTMLGASQESRDLDELLRLSYLS